MNREAAAEAVELSPLVFLDPDLRPDAPVLKGWGSQLGIFAPEALAEYERCFRNPAMIHASCEDYRAAASIDLEHDAADRQRKLACPLLALWGTNGVPHRCHDVLAIWRDYAGDVRGHTLAAGHFLAEEQPEQTAEALLAFLLVALRCQGSPA